MDGPQLPLIKIANHREAGVHGPLRLMRPKPVVVAVVMLALAAFWAPSALSPQGATHLLVAEGLRRGEGLTVWGAAPKADLRPGMPSLLAAWQAAFGAEADRLPWLMAPILLAALAGCYAMWTELSSRPLALLTVLTVASSLTITGAARDPTPAAALLCCSSWATYAWLRGVRRDGRWLWLGCFAWLAANAFHRDALFLTLGACGGLMLATGAHVSRVRAAVCALLTAAGALASAWYFGAHGLSNVANAEIGVRVVGFVADVGRMCTSHQVPTLLSAALFLPAMALGAVALGKGAGRIALAAGLVYLVAGIAFATGSEFGLLPAAPLLLGCLLEGLPRWTQRLRLSPTHAAAMPLTVGSLLILSNVADTLHQTAWPTPGPARASQRSLREVARFLALENDADDRFLAVDHAAELSYLSHLPCEPAAAAQRLVEQVASSELTDDWSVNVPLVVLALSPSASEQGAPLRRALRYHNGFTTVFRNRDFEVYRRVDATAARILASRAPALSVPAAQRTTPPRLARRDRTVKDQATRGGAAKRQAGRRQM